MRTWCAFSLDVFLDTSNLYELAGFYLDSKRRLAFFAPEIVGFKTPSIDGLEFGGC
jgi:hypothetical protein